MTRVEVNHLLSSEQFTRESIERYIALADKFEAFLKEDREAPQVLQGMSLASFFCGESTRTRFSEENAAQKLGGAIVSTPDGKNTSSLVKEESIEDTIRFLSRAYFKGIIFRHSETGAAERGSRFSCVPVINAGDGDGEHPTQALKDLYTIKKAHGRLDDLNIVFVGDLERGRVVHSLAPTLCRETRVKKMTCVSLDFLRLPPKYRDYLSSRLGDRYVECERLEDALRDADILYMMRTQLERPLKNPLHDQLAKEREIVLTKTLLSQLNPSAIIMHPKPRKNELPIFVDEDPRAVYFDQEEYGVPMWMSILATHFAPGAWKSFL